MSFQGKLYPWLFFFISFTLLVTIWQDNNSLEVAHQRIETLSDAHKHTNERLTDTELEILNKQQVIDSLTKQITELADALAQEKEATAQAGERLKELQQQLEQAKEDRQKAEDAAALAEKQARARKKARERPVVAKTTTTARAATMPVSTAPATPSRRAAPTAAAQTFFVEATAYTAYCTGCSGVTRTGIDLRANPGLKVIAVDPRVIPLGSKVFVEGYGHAIAGDTGGAIKGRKIDLFMAERKDALQWGRRTVKISVLN